MRNSKKRKHSRSRSRDRHRNGDRTDEKLQKMQRQLDNLTNQLSQFVQTLKPQAVPKSAEVLQPEEITSEEVQIPGRKKKKKRGHIPHEWVLIVEIYTNSTNHFSPPFGREKIIILHIPHEWQKICQNPHESDRTIHCNLIQ